MFPFWWKGKKYDSCAKSGNYTWCPTETFENGTYVGGTHAYGKCNEYKKCTKIAQGI